MWLAEYFYPFFRSFIFAVAGISATVYFFSGITINAKRKQRQHINQKNILRWGGIPIILSFLASLLLDKNLFISHQIGGIMMAAFLIIIFGLLDDIWEISWKYQLVFQIMIAVLVFFWGVRVEYITNPFGGLVYLQFGNFWLPSLVFVIFWVLVIVNAMNWVDGIDGLSGGVAFIGALTIFLLSFLPEVNQPPVGIIAIAFAGAIFGFLLFNFDPARIIAGTSGSFFFGFFLAMLSIFAGTKIATALLVMTLPLVDFLWVIGERLRAGSSIFQADKRHLHYKLMEIGWSSRKIALFYYLITLIVSVIALQTRSIGKLAAIMLSVFFMFCVILAVNKKITKLKSL